MITTEFMPDMKRIFILWMLISFGMICSCQKQDSAAEQQLAQRKAELDTREKALDERLSSLDERVNASDERVKALAEKERTPASALPTAPDAQPQEVNPNPAQVKAESDGRIQQLSADARALVAHSLHADPAKVEKDRGIQEQLAQSQRELEERESSSRQRKLERTREWMMSRAAASPTAEATSPTSPAPP